MSWKMALFGSKGDAKKDIPVRQVKSMKEQGINNNQIIQTLQRDGYTSAQIFEAMNQADMMPAVNDVSPDQTELERQQPMPQQQPNFDDFSSSNNFSQPRENLSNVPAFKPQTGEIEEVVESIIEEKWEEIAKDINRIIGWKNKVEAKLSSIEQDFNNLKEDFDKLHNAVIGKIGEYDRNILTVGAEVKAMEKVFSKVLPVFTENVNELSKITDSIKKRKD